MFRTSIVILVATACLVGCSGTQDNSQSSSSSEVESATRTVATETLISHDEDSYVGRFLKIQEGLADEHKQATPKRMKDACMMAIADDESDADQIYLPDAVDFTDLGGKDVQMFSAAIDFSYLSKASGLKQPAHAYCQVTTRDGIVEDVSSVVAKRF